MQTSLNPHEHHVGVHKHLGGYIYREGVEAGIRAAIIFAAGVLA